MALYVGNNRRKAGEQAAGLYSQYGVCSTTRLCCVPLLFTCIGNPHLVVINSSLAWHAEADNGVAFAFLVVISLRRVYQAVAGVWLRRYATFALFRAYLEYSVVQCWCISIPLFNVIVFLSVMYFVGSYAFNGWQIHILVDGAATCIQCGDGLQLFSGQGKIRKYRGFSAIRSFRTLLGITTTLRWLSQRR